MPEANHLRRSERKPVATHHPVDAFIFHQYGGDKKLFLKFCETHAREDGFDMNLILREKIQQYFDIIIYGHVWYHEKKLLDALNRVLGTDKISKRKIFVDICGLSEEWKQTLLEYLQSSESPRKRRSDVLTPKIPCPRCEKSSKRTPDSSPGPPSTSTRDKSQGSISSSVGYFDFQLNGSEEDLSPSRSACIDSSPVMNDPIALGGQLMDTSGHDGSTNGPQVSTPAALGAHTNAQKVLPTDEVSESTTGTTQGCQEGVTPICGAETSAPATTAIDLTMEGTVSEYKYPASATGYGTFSEPGVRIAQDASRFRRVVNWIIYSCGVVVFYFIFACGLLFLFDTDYIGFNECEDAIESEYTNNSSLEADY